LFVVYGYVAVVGYRVTLFGLLRVGCYGALRLLRLLRLPLLFAVVCCVRYVVVAVWFYAVALRLLFGCRLRSVGLFMRLRLRLQLYVTFVTLFVCYVYVCCCVVVVTFVCTLLRCVYVVCLLLPFTFVTLLVFICRLFVCLPSLLITLLIAVVVCYVVGWLRSCSLLIRSRWLPVVSLLLFICYVTFALPLYVALFVFVDLVTHARYYVVGLFCGLLYVLPTFDFVTLPHVYALVTLVAVWFGLLRSTFVTTHVAVTFVCCRWLLITRCCRSGLLR
jgi:hypothetical protein